jgi:hypothetical protein
MTTSQTIGLYGLHICAGAFFALMVLENYWLKKRIKAQQEIIEAFRAEVTTGQALIKVQRAILIEAGIINGEEQRKLDG